MKKRVKYTERRAFMFVHPFVLILGLAYLVGLGLGWTGHRVEMLDELRRGEYNTLMHVIVSAGLLLAPVNIIMATRKKAQDRARVRRSILEMPHAPGYFGPGDIESAKQAEDENVAIAVSNPLWEIVTATTLLLLVTLSWL